MRSVSGNIGIGEGNAETGSWDPIYLHAKRASDLTIPGPTASWTYVKEHPDSINDAGCFAPQGREIVDIPATCHNGGGGQLRLRRQAFRNPQMGGSSMKSQQATVVSFMDATRIPTPVGDKDWEWYRYHTPRVRDGLWRSAFPQQPAPSRSGFGPGVAPGLDASAMVEHLALVASNFV